MSAGTTLTAVAPGAYVVEFTANGRAWTCPVVALTSIENEYEIFTEPVVIDAADGHLGTPSELELGRSWRMRPAGGTR